MERYQFQEQMQRCIGIWGKSHFNENRVGRIWHIVKSLSARDFEGIVDTMLDNMRYAPLPKDFQDASRSKRRYITQKPDPVSYDCTDCFDMGYLRWETPKLHYCAIRCHCTAGGRQRHTIPQAPQHSKAKPWDSSLFRPNKPIEHDGITISHMSEKIEWWRRVLLNSAAFWVNNLDEIPKAPVPKNYAPQREEREEWWQR